MKNRIKFILFSLIFTFVFTSCVFAASDKNKVEDKEQVKIEKDIKNKEKTKEDNKKSDKKENSTAKEKPEDLIYNIVVAKNGSITTDHISEATYGNGNYLGRMPMGGRRL